MSTPTPEPFDLLGPLPQGTTMLEASAGTGKTYTVAGLVTRYVAEGVAAMDELLVVSFSREASRELRERVRERLVAARDGLAGALLDQVPTDPLIARLAAAGPEELAVRHRRLADACASFDAATVTTTHGFCQQVLTALGTACDHDPDSALVEDVRELVHEAADDLYLRKWGLPTAPAAELSRAEFRELSLDVARDRGTELLPPPGTEGRPGLRRKIGEAVRDEVERRKRRHRVIDYDDLLLRLAEALADRYAGDVARRRLRERYRVVLVDEFQDTDTVQWDILRDAFHGHRTMVLIGDPKQSIYRFRGADVYAYLDAAGHASARATLPVNHRSDALLLRGLDTVLNGAALGDEQIRVLPVQAFRPQSRLSGITAPVRLRVLPRDGLKQSREGLVTVGPARELVADDVAGQTIALLTGNARRDGEPLRPGDVAVLVRTNQQARLIKEKLNQAGVPAVLTGRNSVFAAPAAREWQLLLEAMEQPHRATRVHRFAVGALVGADAAALAEPASTLGADLGLRLRQWARVLEERGVAALFEAVSLDREVAPRLLAQTGGERLLTDLRHIAQSLHEAVLAGRLGLTATLTWLRRRREEAAADAGLERSQRLESDAAAVQVITVHTSKGLQFPVVMVPFAWDLWVRPDPSSAVFHDRARRRRDVGGPGGPDWNLHRDAHQQEEVDEELRLAYVALTRAESHLLTWWVASTNTASSPLHRLLLHDQPELVAPQRIRVPSDRAALDAFQARATASGGGLVVELTDPGTPQRFSPPPAAGGTLELARLDRPLDLTWRRTSYSALTRDSHEQRLGSEPEQAARDDEADLETVVPAAGADPDQGLLAVTSRWSELAGGASFGTMVHAALERLENADDEQQVRDAVTAALGPAAAEAEADALTDGLLEALATPLGPLADGLALRDLPARDRLAELEFELPLAGGDRPGPLDPAAPAGLLGDLVPLWRRHLPDGPLAPYAEALAGLEPAPLRGYLTGSIDAVLRVGPATARRYVVVDYKTNRLGPPDEPLTAWHYRPEALTKAMIEAHYPLQALLYCAALHRYLRWRQPGYDPQQHLGGALYLFLRGMVPGRSCADGSAPGVFAWRPPAALVLETSELLAGRALVSA